MALAAPAAGDQKEALGLYERGESAFAAGRFDDAARLFEESYLASRRPRLLWNAAVANRRQYELDRDPARLRKARALLQNYGQLAESPGEKEEAATEERAVTAELDRLEAKVTTASPPTKVESPPRVEAPPAALPSTVPPEQSAPRNPPIYTRWWLWTIVGAAVVAGAATGLAVGLTPRGAPPSEGGNFKVSF